jgi:uncharacterized membrane protein YfcA
VKGVDLKNFLIFAVVFFIGLTIGNWILDLLHIAGGEPIGILISLLVPSFIVYVIWKKVQGEKL